jgi:hypothetical protein
MNRQVRILMAPMAWLPESCLKGTLVSLRSQPAKWKPVSEAIFQNGSESTFQRAFHWPQPCPTKRPPKTHPEKTGF